MRIRSASDRSFSKREMKLGELGQNPFGPKPDLAPNKRNEIGRFKIKIAFYISWKI